MKQVLISSIKQYVFPLPLTYMSLIHNIKKRENIQLNSINIYSKGKLLTEKNYKNLNKDLNEDLILLDILPNIKGGSYPNINNTLGYTILNIVITTLCGTILLPTISGFTNNSISKKSLLETIKEITFLPSHKINPWFEIFYLSIYYYIFSVLPVSLILALKNRICPYYKTPSLSLFLYSLIPFPIVLLTWFLLPGIIKSENVNNQNTLIYSLILMVIAIILCISGTAFTYYANKSLNDQQNKKMNNDLFYIPFIAVVFYLFLRFPLLIKIGNSSFITDIFFILVTFLFVSIGISPNFVNALNTNISGPFASHCKQ
jgi:uncharacterized membrane protein YidH (DUF202 family)